MADTKSDPRRIFINNVRLSYPTLRTKKAAVAGGKEKFSASFLMDPKTPEGQRAIKACQAAVAAAEAEHYGADKVGFITKVVEDPKRIALKKGERCKNKDGEVYSGYAGMVALTTSADRRPMLVTKDKQDFLETHELDDIEETFFGGLYVDAEVSFYCISDTDKGGNGLFCTVEAIRTRDYGQAFGGGQRTDIGGFDDLDEDDGIGAGEASAAAGDDLLGDDDDLLAT